MENATLPRSNCTLYYYNKDIIRTVILNQTISAIAVLATLFAIFIIIIFKKWQCFSQRLIIYLIVTTMLVSLARALERVDYLSSTYTDAHRGFCTFIGYVTLNVTWMFFFSVAFITLYLLLTVVSNWHMERYERVYVFFIFVFPWTFTWIPLVKHAYGRAGAWCWIRSIDVDTCKPIAFGRVIQLVIFYIPITLVVLFEVVAYLVILCKLHSLRKRWKTSISNTPEETTTNKLLRNELYSLFAYPIIHIASLIPLVAMLIYEWVTSTPSLVLWYLVAISIPTQGILFTLILTLNADTRRRLRWSHFHSAIKNYKTSKVVSEYKEGEMDTIEVSYSKFTESKT